MKPRRRSKNNSEDVKWIHLALDRDQWRVSVNTLTALFYVNWCTR
jgi:hypothetical protein